MTRQEMERQAVGLILKQIFDSQQLSTPIYCAEVTSEEVASELAHILPLLYIWNEAWPAGTITLSVNGALLGYLMEALVPREDESFKFIFESVTAALSTAVRDSVIEVCEKAGMPPSLLFADGGGA